MMRHSAIGIYSTGKILLDGVIAAPGEGGAKVPAILLCHPHPMLGGDMNSPVVAALEYEANERGLASLRFDFRGVSRSEGDFSNGDEEWNDVKHALNFLKGFPGVDGSKIGVVGYSFGASVILKAISKIKPAKAFALVAPPLGSVDVPPVKKDKRAKLFVVGGNDAVVPSPRLQGLLDDLRGQVQFSEIPDADHRLNGHEEAVAKRVVDFMLQTLLP